MTNSTLTLQAYAKINLTLDVFSKRADGYHDIASVMQSIALSDTLHFTRQREPGIRFTCETPDMPELRNAIPLDGANLVVRAAQAALHAAQEQGTTVEAGVAIHLVKRIPAQAGLGGGSTDAAATLRGVQALLGLNLGDGAMRNLAAELGSDIPFFLLGGTVVARGRGEKLTALPDAPGMWTVVVKPDDNVSTGWAYNELDAIPERKSHRATRRMEDALREGDYDRVLAFQSNDFELPIFQHHPKLAWLHDELMMAGALTARLCGSGSALYGIARSQADAERVATLLRKRYPHTYVAGTLPRAEACPPILTVSTVSEEAVR